MQKQRPIHWLRAHPFAADVLLAVLIASISVGFHLTERGAEYHEPSAWGAVLTLGATLPIAWRRRHPIAVLAVVMAFQMVAEGFNYTGSGWSGVIITVYTMGTMFGSAQLWRVVALVLPITMAFVVWGVIRGDAPWQAIISAPVMFVGAVVVGDNMRRRREHVAELAERAERAERERELLAHQHVREERTRVARELHDVVAHSVSLMVIQTSAARRQLAVDPAKADAALGAVEDAGRQAMNEMRRILGVLRDESGSQSLAPQPSLADLDGLTDAATDLPITVRTDGVLHDLPAGVELSAFRIVQEALTNVRRHAGPVRQVDVSVARSDHALTVEVVDDGRGASVAPSPNGFGLMGMRERVSAYEGELVAGPRVGGGWRVRASFPLGAA